MTKEFFVSELDRQVKLVRTEYGFTQDVMAKILGLSKKTLVEIEKSRSGHFLKSSCKTVSLPEPEGPEIMKSLPLLIFLVLLFNSILVGYTVGECFRL